MWFLHWLAVHTGTVDESGPYYGFWSGFGSDLGEITLVAGVIALVRNGIVHHKQRLTQAQKHHDERLAQAEGHHAALKKQAEQHHARLLNHLTGGGDR